MNKCPLYSFLNIFNIYSHKMKIINYKPNNMNEREMNY